MKNLHCCSTQSQQARHMKLSYSVAGPAARMCSRYGWYSARLAQRAAGVVAVAAAAEYRPSSAATRIEVSVARNQENPANFVVHRARPNQSLNHRTRYGRPSWPGLGYAVHFPSPGQAVLPHRAG